MFDHNDTMWVTVEYCAHPIRPWAVEEKCVYCHQKATHKVEETTGPSYLHPMTAYICCGCFYAACGGGNFPKCGKCGHDWRIHETEIQLSEQVVFECNEYVGMGDWCGCEEKKP